MTDVPEQNDNPFDALEEDEVHILAPDYSLKNIIGETIDIKQLFSAENVAKAQSVIDTHKENFLEWVLQDIETLEHCYKKAAANINACEPEIKKLARAAFVIKSQAGTFGFGLATRVAKSLDDFCTMNFKPRPEHINIIRKHIDTLLVIFQKNITGDGGAVGTELANSLHILIEKYKH